MAENYWITVQKKAFLRWCNELLKKRSLSINDLETDFKDGKLLIQMLEILTSKSIKHNRNPKMEVQRMENLTVALQFMKDDCNVHLVNIGPNDVHNGNLKLILGLIWAIILQFKIKSMSGEEGNANKELLDWVNRQIPSYNIKNFTSDWQSGKALCALAASLYPGVLRIPQDFTNDPMTDCTLGVNVSSQKLGIPQVMDVEDIVNHPEQHSMMTYISYFRDYSNQCEHQKQREQEMTPDISKCIVYGVGLEPGNEAGKETYFTIEVRNSADRKIPRGGHNILVRVTGHHSQSAFNAADNADGTYYVTYTPEDDGNYVIEVRLDDKPIQGSPYHVFINAVKGPTVTEPHPHWFVQDTMKPPRWAPYDNDISQELESYFTSYGGGTVTIQNGAYKVDISAREELNMNKKNLFGHPFEKRPICRATWFWAGDDGNWNPYSEQTCVILEKAYKENGFACNAKVDISDPKKSRYVVDENGIYKQYRVASDAKGSRTVLRGYGGQLIEKELPKKK